MPAREREGEIEREREEEIEKEREGEIERGRIIPESESIDITTLQKTPHTDIVLHQTEKSSMESHVYQVAGHKHAHEMYSEYHNVQ